MDSGARASERMLLTFGRASKDPFQVVKLTRCQRAMGHMHSHKLAQPSSNQPQITSCLVPTQKWPSGGLESHQSESESITPSPTTFPAAALFFLSAGERRAKSRSFTVRSAPDIIYELALDRVGLPYYHSMDQTPSSRAWVTSERP